MSNRFDVLASVCELVEPQHRSRCAIGELERALAIDDGDAFDHAGEDRFHPRAVTRQVGDAPPEHMDRIIRARATVPS